MSFFFLHISSCFNFSVFSAISLMLPSQFNSAANLILIILWLVDQITYIIMINCLVIVFYESFQNYYWIDIYKLCLGDSFNVRYTVCTFQDVYNSLNILTMLKCLKMFKFIILIVYFWFQVLLKTKLEEFREYDTHNSTSRYLFATLYMLKIQNTISH